MKGRNNARTHKGNYGLKEKREADYGNIYARYPMLRDRPAQSSLADLTKHEDPDALSR